MAIRVEGEIDLATVDQLDRAMRRVVDDAASDLVVDLTAASFMDSTGLKSLLTVDKDLSEAGRSLAIAVKPGPISRLIDVSGVESLTIVDDVSQVAGK